MTIKACEKIYRLLLYIQSIQISVVSYIQSRCLTWTGQDKHLCIFSILKVNEFHFVINCLNINRVTIYRARCLGIMAFKISPTKYFHHNSERKNTNIPISKMKLRRFDGWWVSFFYWPCSHSIKEYKCKSIGTN